MRRYLSWLAVVVSTLALVLVGPQAATAAPGAPGIVGPTGGGTVASTPVLQWARVSGAVRYDVALSATPDFSGTPTFSQTTANTYATPVKDLPVGDYWWRVRAVDRAGTAGAYATASFTRTSDAQPVPSHPAADATLEYPDDAPYYAWEALPGAKSYELQVDDDAAFIGAPAPVTTPNTSYSPTTAPPFDTLVHWRVRARSANNVYSQWSAPRSYRMTWSAARTIERVAPPSQNATPVEQVVLRWKPVPGAAFYQLDLSPDANFNDPVYDDAKVLGNTFVPKVTLPAGAYYWRVRPMSSSATPEPGTWSDVSAGGPYTFTKAWPAAGDAPRPQGTEDGRFAQVTLLQPANGDFGLQQPELSWSPQRSASHYEVQLGSDANFSPGTFGSCTTEHTTLTPFRRTQPLSSTMCPAPFMGYVAPGVVRYWRVRAVDAASGVLGPFSAVRSFLYDPATIRQETPSDGATVETPVLTWSPVPNISRFKVTVTGCGKTTSGTVWGTTWVPESLDLKNCPAGPWSWAVQGIEDDGEQLTRLPNSASWPTFRTDTAPAVEPDPGTVSEESTGAAWRPPLLDWAGVAGAATYQVLASVAGANSYSALGRPTNQTAAAFTGDSPSGSAYDHLLPPGDYEYYVQARTATGTQVSVSPVGTFTIGPMPLTTLTGPAHCPLGSCTDVEYDTPRFTWDPVEGAGSYLLYLATDPLFTNITRVYTTSHTSLTPTESLPDSQAGQATYWFVRPCYTTGSCGPFDASVFEQARAFRKTTRPVEDVRVTLPVPAGETEATADPQQGVDYDASANSVVIRWRDYLTTNRLDQTSVAAPTGDAVDLEAAHYQVQVSTTANFTGIVDDVTGIDQTTYVSPAGSYPDGPLYVRVRAFDRTGNPMTWSAVRSIVTSTPAPSGQAPTAGAEETGTPLLAWDPMPSAAQYDVEVYRNPGSALSPINLVGSVRTRLTTAALPSALAAGQTYGWRVRRVDANGRVGGWSAQDNAALSTFRVRESAPTLLGPAGGAVTRSNSLLFSWAPAAGATRYRIDASTTSSFGTLVESVTTDATSWAPGQLSPAWPNGVLYWRVSSLDANNAVLGTSLPRTLTRDLSTVGEFSAVDPSRVLDTRTGTAIGAGQTRTVRLTGGSTGIPASGVTTVVVNVTAVAPTASSYLSLWAYGTARPNVSTLNFPKGRSVSNHATVPVDAAGRASIVNAAGSTHVLVDVVGYYSGGNLPRGDRFRVAPSPTRILDTRGVGGYGPAPLTAGESRLVEVAGLGGVPSTATAVVANVTAVGPTSTGSLTVHPAGTARPTTTSVSFPAGANVPSLVTMRLGSGGDVRVYNSAGRTHLLVDVVGWYTPGDPSPDLRFNAVTPARIADTRSATPPRLADNSTRTFVVRGTGGVPATTAARAVVLNVTAVSPSSAGYLTVHASGTARPGTSNLNYAAGQNVANQVVAPIGADGRVAVYTSKGLDVILDVVGWMG